MAAQLENKIRRFIVMRLAQFQYPTLVAKEVLEEFGVTVSPQRVQKYDPTKYAGRTLAKALKEYFYEMRERHVTDLDNQPLAHQLVRLERLDLFILQAAAKGDFKTAIAGMSVAQREMVDYTFIAIGNTPEDGA